MRFHLYFVSSDIVSLYILDCSPCLEIFSNDISEGWLSVLWSVQNFCLVLRTLDISLGAHLWTKKRFPKRKDGDVFQFWQTLLVYKYPDHYSTYLYLMMVLEYYHLQPKETNLTSRIGFEMELDYNQGDYFAATDNVVYDTIIREFHWAGHMKCSTIRLVLLKTDHWSSIGTGVSFEALRRATSHFWCSHKHALGIGVLVYRAYHMKKCRYFKVLFNFRLLMWGRIKRRLPYHWLSVLSNVPNRNCY